MNKPSEDELREKSSLKVQKYIDEEEAEKRTYKAIIDGEERLVIPDYSIFAMMRDAAGGFKVGRSSARKYIGGCIRIEPENIPIAPNKYEIDTRIVKIGTASVVRARPKIKDWSAEFYVIYDDEIFIDPKTIYNILVSGGKRSGLLDYRPQKGGWFGTFTVEKFEEAE